MCPSGDALLRLCLFITPTSWPRFMLCRMRCIEFYRNLCTHACHMRYTQVYPSGRVCLDKCFFLIVILQFCIYSITFMDSYTRHCIAEVFYPERVGKYAQLHNLDYGPSKVRGEEGSIHGSRCAHRRIPCSYLTFSRGVHAGPGHPGQSLTSLGLCVRPLRPHSS